MAKPNAIRDFADGKAGTFREVIKKTVETAGTIKAAAEIIGVNRVSLSTFLKNHNIEVVTERRFGGRRQTK